MVDYKLVYFNVRAKAEPIRLLFALAGVEYEDVRVNSQEEFNVIKPETPFGQVPYLEAEGIKLCQTNTILRYLGDKLGYSGSSPLEGALVQMITDCTEDMLKPVLDIRYVLTNEEEKSAARKKYYEEKAPACLANFEKLLKQNGGGDGYFVGDKITYADVALYHWISWVSEMMLAALPDRESISKLNGYPKLKAHSERVAALPGIARWLETRPVTEL